MFSNNVKLYLWSRRQGSCSLFTLPPKGLGRSCTLEISSVKWVCLTTLVHRYILILIKEHFHSSEKKYNQPPTESPGRENHFLIILGMKDMFVNFSGLLMGNIIDSNDPHLYQICVLNEVYLTQQGL
jgi:hypothetical protein